MLYIVAKLFYNPAQMFMSQFENFFFYKMTALCSQAQKKHITYNVEMT